MERLKPYSVRVSTEVKAALPAAARRYGMTAPELVRTIIGMVASGHILLTLQEHRAIAPRFADRDHKPILEEHHEA